MRKQKCDTRCGGRRNGEPPLEAGCGVVNAMVLEIGLGMSINA